MTAASDDPARSSDRRARRHGAAELADELRALQLALATCELDSARLAEATQRVRAIRGALEGPPRRRWYEAGDPAPLPSPDSRSAYLDQSPVRGLQNPMAPPLEIQLEQRPDGRRVALGRARLSLAYEGPPRGVHGGWVAALLDEVLGAVQGSDGTPGVTAILTVKYRDLTPIDTDLRLEAWIESRRGRRHIARATCHAGATLTAEAEGTFIEVDFDRVHARMRAG